VNQAQTRPPNPPASPQDGAAIELAFIEDSRLSANRLVVQSVSKGGFKALVHGLQYHAAHDDRAPKPKMVVSDNCGELTCKARDRGFAAKRPSSSSGSLAPRGDLSLSPNRDRRTKKCERKLGSCGSIPAVASGNRAFENGNRRFAWASSGGVYCAPTETFPCRGNLLLKVKYTPSVLRSKHHQIIAAQATAADSKAA
jgi:hypothetical protein